MSEGNIKCKLFGNCTNFTTKEECNTACDYYAPKNPEEELEIPDEVLEQAEVKSKNPKDINLKVSGLQKFDKTHEFMVLKKHVFEMQSISPKKIILKYKRKLNQTDKIADGVYVFVDKDDKLLVPHKVFAEFDRKAKANAKNKS